MIEVGISILVDVSPLIDERKYVILTVSTWVGRDNSATRTLF